MNLENTNPEVSYVSTKGTGYVPSSFFRGLKVDTFDKKNVVVGVSLPWLVRTFHLFEGVANYLNGKFASNYQAYQIMNGVALAGFLDNPMFSSVTGRLLDSSRLRFISKLQPSCTAEDYKVLYSKLSADLKIWDEWYLKGKGVMLNKIFESVAPITLQGMPSGSNIMAQGQPFKFGSSPDEYVPSSVTMMNIDCKLVTYELDRDESYEPVSTVKPSGAIQPDFVLKDGFTSADLEAAFQARSKGASLTILPIMQQQNEKSPLSAKVAEQAAVKEEELKKYLNPKSVTPVLDWLRGIDKVIESSPSEE